MLYMQKELDVPQSLSNVYIVTVVVGRIRGVGC